MGTAERRERERKQRQELILNAAEKVLSTKGFDNSTIDDVARESELSKGLLYIYFKNKKEMCLTIVLRGLRLLSSISTNILNQKIKGIDKILTVANEYLDFYKKSPLYFKALLYYCNNKCDSKSKVLQEANAENEKINNIITKIISSGIEDGSIRKDIEPVKFSYAFLGQLIGLLPIFCLSSNEPEITTKSYEIYPYTVSIIEKVLSSKN